VVVEEVEEGMLVGLKQGLPAFVERSWNDGLRS